MSDIPTTSPTPDSPEDEPLEQQQTAPATDPSEPAAANDVVSEASPPEADEPGLTASDPNRDVAHDAVAGADQATSDLDGEPVLAGATEASVAADPENAAGVSEAEVVDDTHDGGTSDDDVGSEASTSSVVGTDGVDGPDAPDTGATEVTLDSNISADVQERPGDDIAIAPEDGDEPQTTAWDASEPSDDEDRNYDWPIVPQDKVRERPLPWLDWRFSIILPLAALGIVATMLWQTLSASEMVTFRIEDAETGEAIAGATVVVDQLVFVSSDDGTVVIERPSDTVDVLVEAGGYHAVTGVLNDASGNDQVVQLRPDTESQSAVRQESA